MTSSYWDLFLQSPTYYLYWGTAIVASVVFLIQIALLLFGFDTDADFSGGDTSFDIDGLSLVSVKTVACFLLGFGWTGVLCYPEIQNQWWLGTVAFSVGALFMLIVYYLLCQVPPSTRRKVSVRWAMSTFASLPARDNWAKSW